MGEHGRDERDDSVGIDDGFGAHGKPELEAGDARADGTRRTAPGDGAHGEGVAAVFRGSARELGTEVHR